MYLHFQRPSMSAPPRLASTAPRASTKWADTRAHARTDLARNTARVSFGNSNNNGMNIYKIVSKGLKDKSNFLCLEQIMHKCKRNIV